MALGSIGARASVIGVASHHQRAAIIPSDDRRSASGVRREIGSILRAGTVDYPFIGVLPRCSIALLPPHPLRQFYHRHDKVVTLLDKIRNTRHLNRLKSPPHWGPIWAATSQTITPAASRGRKLIGECMRRRVLDPRVAVLRHFAAAGLALLIGSAGAFAQSGTPAPQDQSRQAAGRQCRRRHQGQPAQDRRIRRGGPGHQRPGRKPGMRLARPPRGAPDVARRPRYRLPPPRSLRPVRLPRRPCPGDLPLPDPLWRTDRPQGGRNPGQPHSCLLDQSGRPAPDGRGGEPGAAAPATAGNAAPAPAASPSPAPSAAPAPPAK